MKKKGLGCIENCRVVDAFAQRTPCSSCVRSHITCFVLVILRGHAAWRSFSAHAFRRRASRSRIPSTTVQWKHVRNTKLRRRCGKIRKNGRKKQGMEWRCSGCQQVYCAASYVGTRTDITVEQERKCITDGYWRRCISCQKTVGSTSLHECSRCHCKRDSSPLKTIRRSA